VFCTDSEPVCRVSIYLSIPFLPTFPRLRVTPGMFCSVSVASITVMYYIAFAVKYDVYIGWWRITKHHLAASERKLLQHRTNWVCVWLLQVSTYLLRLTSIGSRECGRTVILLSLRSESEIPQHSCCSCTSNWMGDFCLHNFSGSI